MTRVGIAETCRFHKSYTSQHKPERRGEGEVGLLSPLTPVPLSPSFVSSRSLSSSLSFCSGPRWTSTM